MTPAHMDPRLRAEDDACENFREIPAFAGMTGFYSGVPRCYVWADIAVR